ncbi:MAG: AraC family transcriptional regulator [Pseudomonadota bacterium]
MMYRRDHATIEDVRHEGPGYALVARAPGACRIGVPAERHFLDVHLGRADAAYRISGFAAAGEVAPPSTFVFLPAGRPREVVAARSGWSVQLAFEPGLLQVNGHATAKGGMANGQGATGAADASPWSRARCHLEDDVMVAVAGHLTGLWRSELPTPSAVETDAVVRVLLMRLVHRMVAGDFRPTRTPSAASRVQAVIEHIEGNLSASLTLTDLAAVACISPYHFARLFREETGRSPHQYVVERRVAQAKRRLHQSDAPIAGIAHDCGFGSQSHMTDVFRKILGRTPGAVRKDGI